MLKRRITPFEYDKARSSIKVVKPSSQLKAMEFRNNVEYNSGRISIVSARLAKRIK